MVRRGMESELKAVHSCAFALLAAALWAAAVFSDAQSAAAGAAPGGGIWKAAVPPASMAGEFDSLDPLGVAAGAKIKADCSLNWTVLLLKRYLARVLPG